MGGVKGKQLPPPSGYLEGDIKDASESLESLYQTERCHNP
jgi:hypothetical protein